MEEPIILAYYHRPVNPQGRTSCLRRHRGERSIHGRLEAHSLTDSDLCVVPIPTAFRCGQEVGCPTPCRCKTGHDRFRSSSSSTRRSLSRTPKQRTDAVRLGICAFGAGRQPTGISGVFSHASVCPKASAIAIRLLRAPIPSVGLCPRQRISMFP